MPVICSRGWETFSKQRYSAMNATFQRDLSCPSRKMFLEVLDVLSVDQIVPCSLHTKGNVFTSWCCSVSVNFQQIDPEMLSLDGDQIARRKYIFPLLVLSSQE